MTQLSSSSPAIMTWTAATWVQSGPCSHLRCTWRSPLSHRSQSSATSSSAFLRRENISLPHWPAWFVRFRVHDDVTDSKTSQALLLVHRIHELHPFLGLATLEATRRTGSVLTVFHLSDVHDLLLLLLSIVHLKHLEPVLCHTRLPSLSPGLASPVVMFNKRLNIFAEDPWWNSDHARWTLAGSGHACSWPTRPRPSSTVGQPSDPSVDQAPQLDVPLLEVLGVAVEDLQVPIPVEIVALLASSPRPFSAKTWTCWVGVSSALNKTATSVDLARYVSSVTYSAPLPCETSFEGDGRYDTPPPPPPVCLRWDIDSSQCQTYLQNDHKSFRSFRLARDNHCSVSCVSRYSSSVLNGSSVFRVWRIRFYRIGIVCGISKELHLESARSQMPINMCREFK